MGGVGRGVNDGFNVFTGKGGGLDIGGGTLERHSVSKTNQQNNGS